MADELNGQVHNKKPHKIGMFKIMALRVLSWFALFGGVPYFGRSSY